MIKRILILFIAALFIYSFTMISNDGQRPQKTDRMVKLYTKDDGNTTNDNIERKFHYTPLTLEGPKSVGDVVIGPEIAVTGLTGFYNYQFNGNNGHYIYRKSASEVHAIYMTASDSLNISPSRRTKYAFSTNDGDTWEEKAEVPSNVRSGFCTLTLKNDGSAVIGNHYTGSDGFLAGFVNYDLIPGVGSFNGVQVPPNFAWPMVCTFTNGNILAIGTCYRGTTVTDTTAYAMYNSTTNTFGPLVKLDYLNPPTEQSNSSYGTATAPGGKGTILLNPYRETQGNWGKTRIFVSQTTDNGATFTAPTVIFNPHVVNGDSVVPNQNGACDVVLDADGKYYAAFNSNGNSRLYADLKLYIIKQGFNNGEPILVAGGPGTPAPYNIDSMATSMVQQAFIASFDHPCLSLSDDGQYLFVSYSVSFANDTSLGGLNRSNIFYSFAKTSDMVFSAPIRITSPGWDHKYASINRVTPTAGGQYTLYMTYQKCFLAGSYCTSPPDQPVVSRASLIFRKITNASVIGVNNNNQIVKDYKLEQNYPNPFNPSTVISYNIPVNAFVSLKVYDLTGKEVATLVNGMQTAGSKEVEFNASGFASGIYFYKLNVNDFSDTRKMILVK